MLKSEVNYSVNRTISQYPALGRYKRNGLTFFVLFSADSVGTVVNTVACTAHNIGDYSEDWNMEEFEEFDGTVTLVSTKS